jgi:hypothetical protein
MTKQLTADIRRKNAERRLFAARRALTHLVELYDSGRWRLHYKEDAFSAAVREARHSVDYWTAAVAKSDRFVKADAS